MEGSFEQTNCSPNIIDCIKNSYYERPPIKEYFSFKMNRNFTYESVTEKTKKFFQKFTFYHLCFLFSLSVLYIIRNPIFLIFIGTVLASAFLIEFPQKIQDFEITAPQVVGAAVATNLIVAIALEDYWSNFPAFFGLSAFGILLIILHSQFVIDSEEEVTEV